MKRSQVRALLRKARATVNCGGNAADRCPLVADAALEWAWLLMFPGRVLYSAFVHPWFASALLDGLSVRDVTEAGG